MAEVMSTMMKGVPQCQGAYQGTVASRLIRVKLSQGGNGLSTQHPFSSISNSIDVEHFQRLVVGLCEAVQG